MENLNLHKQKLFALIVAGVAFIAILLPWMTVSVNFGGLGLGSRGSSLNGFRGWGLLSLLGVVGVIVASLVGEKTQVYDDTFKKVAMGSFGVIAIGAIVFFLRIKSYGGGGYQGVSTSAGLGLWLCAIAGLAGLAWVAGLIKLPENKPPTTPTPPPPPPKP
jgi:hypothetical protein